MIKKYIGKNRSENLDWLLNVWLHDGPPVCFLQGFSGVGKSDLALEFRGLVLREKRASNAIYYEIADRPTPDVLETLMELSSSLSRDGLPEMESVLFGERDPNLAYAFERALRSPDLIVIDQAQRLFLDEMGVPLPQMNGILAHLRSRQDLPGRLLLICDRMIDPTARWANWIPKRTLENLETAEAVELLEDLLRTAGLADSIPPARNKDDLVAVLGRNPSAIEALVGALSFDTLDEIIGSRPELWEARDREFSQEFLRVLERELLERNLQHMAPNDRKRLRLLSVHRRSFKKEALNALCGKVAEAEQFRTLLVARFLMKFKSGYFSLNPIVREIEHANLRSESTEFKQAHSRAADYHLRPFNAQRIVSDQSQLGSSFAELRYHLVMAGRESDLDVIGQRFTDHLKQEIKSVSPVPMNAEELDERIGVLTALLGNAGAKGLEYHLARCLQSRGKAGDIQQAVIHAERALGHGAPEAAWYLLANLKRQSEGLDAAIAVVRRGIQELKNPEMAAPLYQLGAEMLSGANKTDEAVALLKEGIKVIPPDKNLFSLYQSCADLLAKAGKTDEAVALLKEGIKVIPPDKSLFSLYQSCADLLAKAGKTDEAVALLKESIKVIPPDKGLFALVGRYAELLNDLGKQSEAIEVLRKGIAEIPSGQNVSILYTFCASLLVATSEDSAAVTLLQDGIKVLPADKSVMPLYECLATFYLNRNRPQEAATTMREAVGRNSLPQIPSSTLQKFAESISSAGDLEEGIRTVRDAIKRRPRETPLYCCCADLLAKAGKTDEAVALLKEGIKVIPPDKNLFSLYQSCADLLAKAGKTDEAVALLKEGIKVIPPDKGLVALFQGLSQQYCRKGMVIEAIEALRDGMKVIPMPFARASLEEGLLNLCRASQNQEQLEAMVSTEGFSRPQQLLIEVCAYLDALEFSKALSAVAAARFEFPVHLGLASTEALIRLASSDPNGALNALLSIPNKGFRKVAPILWLETFIHLRRNDSTSATESLTLLLGRTVDTNKELSESFLLDLWDQPKESIEGATYICGYYPVLPPALTGLADVFRRVPFGKPVLPTHSAAAPVGVVVVPPAVGTDEPEVYVSYAWGDDKTPEGIAREEVVNQMCDAVGRTGRVVGRDKTVMKPGDSIDAFADKIAKAPRIVAVISVKSLHSKFCMVDEIYSAYQRSGFRRAEFQSKVIALVMDDAAELLKDDIGLVKHWKAVHEQERDGLKAVDPNNKALERWGKVHKLGDMCDHLLDMLDAIKDIIMPRGYENIVKGNFNEVIDRLPPKGT